MANFPLDPATLEPPSHKMALCVISLALITGGAVLCIWSPAFTGIYATFIGGVIGVVSLYLGGNIASRWVTGNANAKVMPAISSDVSISAMPISAKAPDIAGL